MFRIHSHQMTDNIEYGTNLGGLFALLCAADSSCSDSVVDGTWRYWENTGIQIDASYRYTYSDIYRCDSMGEQRLNIGGNMMTGNVYTRGGLRMHPEMQGSCEVTSRFDAGERYYTGVCTCPTPKSYSHWPQERSTFPGPYTANDKSAWKSPTWVDNKEYKCSWY